MDGKLAERMISSALRPFAWRSDAEDLAQECRAAILQRVNRYDPGKGSPSNFLFIIIRFAVINYFRRNACQKRGPMIGQTVISLDTPIEGDGNDVGVFGDTIADPHVNVEAEVLGRLELEQARRAIRLSGASPRQKAVLLARLRGLTLEEIGVRYGLSRERVRQLEEIGLLHVRRFVASGRKTA